MQVHAATEADARSAVAAVQAAITVADAPPPPRPVVVEAL
jgi:hypothetical protein